MNSSLSVPESAELAQHESTIRETKDSFMACGKALAAIRDQRLYRATFHTFEQYCVETWGWVSRYANRLIATVGVVESLPEKTAKKIVNEAQATELGKAKPKVRAKVVAAAEKLGAVTAETIKTARKNLGTIVPVTLEKSQKKEIRLDSTGYAIPEELWPLWERRGEVQTILTAISKARGALRGVMEAQGEGEPDPLYFHANVSGAQAHLHNAWTSISMALPFAVCASCQGRGRSTCKLCKTSGFIPRHTYEHALPAELRAVREKSCVKG